MSEDMWHGIALGMWIAIGIRELGAWVTILHNRRRSTR